MTFTVDDIIEDSFFCDLTPTDKLVNYINLFYYYDRGKNKYSGNKVLSAYFHSQGDGAIISSPEGDNNYYLTIESSDYPIEYIEYVDDTKIYTKIWTSDGQVFRITGRA